MSNGLRKFSKSFHLFFRSTVAVRSTPAYLFYFCISHTYRPVFREFKKINIDRYYIIWYNTKVSYVFLRTAQGAVCFLHENTTGGK